MKAIEFCATIKEGKIEIPRQYLDKVAQHKMVRVLLLMEERPSAPDFIEWLLNHPVRIKGFRPLSREEIYAGQTF